jgi:glucokinase
MLLAGDIGGTNARLALFTDDARKLVHQAVLPSSKYRSLGQAIDSFFDDAGGKRPKIRAATFGIAGPVLNGRVRATNFPWVIDERVLARQLGTPRVTLMNDLVSLALGATAARPKEVEILQGKRRPGTAAGNVVVIAAGTGLGEAALVWEGSRHVPCGTEGGHSDFAPRTQVEWELREYVASRIGGRVSVERIVSGPALGTLYEFFLHKGETESPDVAALLASAGDRNAAIARQGALGVSAPCKKALELFASLYGAEAGNLALKFLSVAGVFVAGGIAASLVPTLREHFLPAFLDKGRFRPLLATMPVAVVKTSTIGLHGSARHAAGRA